MKVLLLLLLLPGCAHRAHVHGLSGRGPGYLYERFDDGYSLIAKNNEARSRALLEICKGQPCTVEVIGEAYLVRVEGQTP